MSVVLFWVVSQLTNVCVSLHMSTGTGWIFFKNHIIDGLKQLVIVDNLLDIIMPAN